MLQILRGRLLQLVTNGFEKIDEEYGYWNSPSRSRCRSYKLAF
jgi:hypothetical protein